MFVIFSTFTLFELSALIVGNGITISSAEFIEISSVIIFPLFDILPLGIDTQYGIHVGASSFVNFSFNSFNISLLGISLFWTMFLADVVAFALLNDNPINYKYKQAYNFEHPNFEL